MSRYYRRGGWQTGPRYWAHYHQSKHRQIAQLFGGIERDILQVFLTLPSFAREGLLSRYGQKYGRQPEAYARKTYPAWQSGSIQPAGTTVERLIELVPPYLSETQRFDLIRKLRMHHLKRKDLHLTTTPGGWRDELAALAQQIIEHGAQCELPPEVYEKATWLTNGDAAAARKLIQVIDEEEARLRLSFIEAEFKRIEYLVETVQNAEPVRHTIELPQGSIFVTIQRKQRSAVRRMIELLTTGEKMDNENDKLVPRARPGGDLMKQRDLGSLLDTSLAKLPEDQQRKLADKVAEERLQLGVSAEKAEQRHYDSARDMANTIRAAEAVERTTGSDYEIKSTHDTASGRTDIRIKKNNNTVTIVVAVVIGIIIYLFLKH
ncbi:MAG: hypothetical protein ABSG78_06030 [Verrucomicrobiota bacterium]|jgi:hypothetical protein